MEEYVTPMEIYMKEKNLRSWFIQNKIIWRYKDWQLFIPCCTVEYTKDKKEIKNNCFPFYHNMLLEIIIALKWNYKEAMNLFNSKDNSYITNWWTTIILKGKFI